MRARAGTYELSGLIKCGICGYGMTFQKKNNGYILVKPCWHITAIGEKCNNRGGSYAELLKIIKDDVNEYIHKCIKILENNDNKIIMMIKLKP